MDGLHPMIKENEHQVIRLFPSLASQARPFHKRSWQQRHEYHTQVYVKSSPNEGFHKWENPQMVYLWEPPIQMTWRYTPISGNPHQKHRVPAVGSDHVARRSASPASSVGSSGPWKIRSRMRPVQSKDLQVMDYYKVN